MADPPRRQARPHMGQEPDDSVPTPVRGTRVGLLRPQVIEVHTPTPIATRHDDDAFRRRVLSEVDDRIRGMAEGLSRHVEQVVRAELSPYIDKLARIDQVVLMLEEDREERANYRADREARERVEKERRELDMHRLTMQRGQVEIEKLNVDVHQAPTEAARRYRVALLGVVVGVITALAGLAGAALGSHGGVH